MLYKIKKYENSLKNRVSILILVSWIFLVNSYANNQSIPEKIVKEEQVVKDIVDTKQLKTEQEIENEKVSDIYNSLPIWIRNKGYIEDGIGVIGVAKKLKYRTIRDVMRIAEHDARMKLARTLFSKISRDLEYKLKEAETNNNIDVIKGLISNSKEIVNNVKLSGVIFKDSYFAKDGNYYVLGVLPKENLNKLKDEAVEKLKRILPKKL